MNIKPIQGYKAPRYPERDDFLAQPELLTDYVPLVWKRKKLVAAALALMSFTGCKKTDTHKPNPATCEDRLVIKKANINVCIEKKPLTAPVFHHGSGQGADGCMVVSPPVFLSESNARSIIIEELKKGGIDIDRQDVVFSGIQVDLMPRNYLEAALGRTDPLEMDGYSNKQNIGFEFVSHEEVYVYSEVFPVVGSSVSDFDLIESAQKLRSKIIRYGRINAGVFYDPLTSSDEKSRDIPDEDFERLTEMSEDERDQYFNNLNEIRQQRLQKTRDESILLLRAQVRDFLKWAKEHGIVGNKEHEQ